MKIRNYLLFSSLLLAGCGGGDGGGDGGGGGGTGTTPTLTTPEVPTYLKVDASTGTYLTTVEWTAEAGKQYQILASASTTNTPSVVNNATDGVTNIFTTSPQVVDTTSICLDQRLCIVYLVETDGNGNQSPRSTARGISDYHNLTYDLYMTVTSAGAINNINLTRANGYKLILSYANADAVADPSLLQLIYKGVSDGTFAEHNTSGLAYFNADNTPIAYNYYVQSYDEQLDASGQIVSEYIGRPRSIGTFTPYQAQFKASWMGSSNKAYKLRTAGDNLYAADIRTTSTAGGVYRYPITPTTYPTVNNVYSYSNAAGKARLLAVEADESKLYVINTMHSIFEYTLATNTASTPYDITLIGKGAPLYMEQTANDLFVATATTVFKFPKASIGSASNIVMLDGLTNINEIRISADGNTLYIASDDGIHEVATAFAGTPALAPVDVAIAGVSGSAISSVYTNGTTLYYTSKASDGALYQLDLATPAASPVLLQDGLYNPSHLLGRGDKLYINSRYVYNLTTATVSKGASLDGSILHPVDGLIGYLYADAIYVIPDAYSYSIAAPTTAPEVSYTAGDMGIDYSLSPINAADYYRVYLNGSLSGDVRIGAGSGTLSPLVDNGTAYNVELAAVNPAGEGPKSTVASVTPGVKITSLVNTNAGISGNIYSTLYWNNRADRTALYFDMEYSTDPLFVSPAPTVLPQEDLVTGGLATGLAGNNKGKSGIASAVPLDTLVYVKTTLSDTLTSDSRVMGRMAKRGRTSFAPVDHTYSKNIVLANGLTFFTYYGALYSWDGTTKSNIQTLNSSSISLGTDAVGLAYNGDTLSPVLYYASTGTAEIEVMDITTPTLGGVVHTVLPTTADLTGVHGIIHNGVSLYAVTNVAGKYQILQLGEDGTNPVVLYESLSPISTLRFMNGYVYWFEANSIKRQITSSGATVDVLATALPEGNDMEVDATHLYYTSGSDLRKLALSDLTETSFLQSVQGGFDLVAGNIYATITKSGTVEAPAEYSALVSVDTSGLETFITSVDSGCTDIQFLASTALCRRGNSGYALIP